MPRNSSASFIDENLSVQVDTLECKLSRQSNNRATYDGPFASRSFTRMCRPATERFSSMKLADIEVVPRRGGHIRPRKAFGMLKISNSSLEVVRPRSVSPSIGISCSTHTSLGDCALDVISVRYDLTNSPPLRTFSQTERSICCT